MTPYQEIEETIADKAQSDGHYAIAFAILQLTKTQETIAKRLSDLGVGNASTQMGAIELLGLAVKEAGESIGSGLSEITEEMRQSD